MSKQRMKDYPDGPGAVPARHWTGICQDPQALELLIRERGLVSYEGLLHTFSTSALSSSRECGLGNNGSGLFSAQQFTKYSRVYRGF